jgi:Ca2+-binding EF-hand superfamily protein
MQANAAEEKKAPPTPEEKAAMFTKKDADADGKLTKEEFLAKVKEENKAKMEANFTKLDKDADGALTKDEYLGTAAGKAKAKGKGKKTE